MLAECVCPWVGTLPGSPTPYHNKQEPPLPLHLARAPECSTLTGDLRERNPTVGAFANPSTSQRGSRVPNVQAKWAG